MSNKNELIAGVQKTEIQKLEDAAGKYSLSSLENKGPFEKALMLAEGIKVLTEELVTEEMMIRIMFLQGSPMGFRTDQDPTKKQPELKGYPQHIVKRCFIEATLRGLEPVGNQWNIIAGNLYIAKEGFKGVLRKFPGFKDFKYNMGVPRIESKKTVVDFDSSWTLNGQPGALCGTIPIITNAYSTPDAILGKMERKLMYRVHAEITGSEVSEFEERDETEFQSTAPKSAIGERAAKALRDSNGPITVTVVPEEEFNSSVSFGDDGKSEKETAKK